ncbi:MAG TPA: glycosyltransferase 87 family protein [Acidimicrobiia bacterium]|nr:glycosyltransferase 87 family protein [Acidimicrobiia bacterium]
MSGRRFLLLFLLLAAVRVVVVPIALSSDATAPSRYRILPGDARRFYKIASQGGQPYRDFAVEYPPVMVGAIEAIDGGSFRSTTVRLMWSQLVVDLAIAAVVAWGWGRRAGIAYLVLGLPFLLYPFLYLRLDLLSVFLAVLGIALVRRRHQCAGGATLALACFAKLWPVVLVPVLIVRRAWRALGAFVAVGVIGTVAWVAWGGVDGPVQVLTFRGAKGWEFESTVGALVRSIGGLSPHVERNAFRVGDMTALVSGALMLALVAGVAAAWILAARAKPRGTDVLDGLAPMAAITTFLVFSPLLSPQFLLWLLPFAAIAAVHGERLVTRLAFVVFVLTVALLALLPELIHGGTFAVLVLAARNAVLIALLAALAVRLVQSAGGRRAPTRLEPARELAA